MQKCPLCPAYLLREVMTTHNKTTPNDAEPSRSAARDGINVLTPRQRRTCALAWCDQLTRAQIAAAHGVHPEAIKKRIQRARRRLRAAGIDPPGDSRRRHRAPIAQLSAFQNV